MQVESNRDVTQNELYVGIGAAGALGGAALAVRATSPIYKKDKKKDVDAATAVVENASSLSPRQERKAQRKFMKENKGREFNVDDAYQQALEVEKANAPVGTGTRGTRRQSQADLDQKWSTPGASSPVPQSDPYHEPAVYRKNANAPAGKTAHTQRLDRLRKMVAAAK